MLVDQVGAENLFVFDEMQMVPTTVVLAHSVIVLQPKRLNCDVLSFTQGSLFRYHFSYEEIIEDRTHATESLSHFGIAVVL